MYYSTYIPLYCVMYGVYPDARIALCVILCPCPMSSASLGLAPTHHAACTVQCGNVTDLPRVIRCVASLCVLCNRLGCWLSSWNPGTRVLLGLFSTVQEVPGTCSCTIISTCIPVLSSLLRVLVVTFGDHTGYMRQ